MGNYAVVSKSSLLVTNVIVWNEVNDISWLTADNYVVLIDGLPDNVTFDWRYDPTTGEFSPPE